MSYTHQEDFGGSSEDRQFAFITTANIVGAGVGGLLVWQLCGLLRIDSLAVMIPLIVFGAGAGAMTTIRLAGISLVEQLQLLTSFRLRASKKATELHPHAATLDTADTLTLFDGDEVLVQPYTPEEVSHGRS